MGLMDTQLYYEVYENDLLWKIGSKRYLEHLIESMDKIILGEDDEKLHINVGHDMTLALILKKFRL